MRKSSQIKIGVFLFIFAFMALYSPRLLADTPDTGKIAGFIYKADRTSPFEKAFVQLKNVATGSVYESTISDAFGAFMIDEIERGLYIVSIRTEEGTFKSRNIIGVREADTAKISFALELSGRDRSENMPVGNADVIASSDPVIYDYRVVASEVPGKPPVETPAEPPANPPGPPDDPPGDPPGPPIDPPADPPADPPVDPPAPPFDPPEPNPSPDHPGKPDK